MIISVSSLLIPGMYLKGYTPHNFMSCVIGFSSSFLLFKTNTQSPVSANLMYISMGPTFGVWKTYQ